MSKLLLVGYSFHDDDDTETLLLVWENEWRIADFFPNGDVKWSDAYATASDGFRASDWIRRGWKVVEV